MRAPAAPLHPRDPAACRRLPLGRKAHAPGPEPPPARPQAAPAVRSVREARSRLPRLSRRRAARRERAARRAARRRYHPRPGAPDHEDGRAGEALRTEALPRARVQGSWRWPLEAGVVSSEFGKRWGKNHNGLDIAADLRVPVYAVAPGEVIYAGNQVSGYGNLLVLRHDEKTTTFYGHNDSLNVKTGDKIAADQVIARLGSTGRSTGPHVHFELRERDKPLDPRARLPKSGF
ncbi:MAG: M23 family metallopeptidase [Elusimicrobia bacterium]|nr:M23 family metallopeptidase [Elusimicrobiota bacterium]